MAHFAEINENNIVTRVIVVDNKDCLDNNGIESESVGAAFCHNIFGGTWKQTSYNKNIRKNYAGIGYTYDSSADVFIPPKPFEKFILNTTTYQWEPSVPYPHESEGSYTWNDNKGEWEEEIPVE
jgi:hypothetical protein